ncbi:MAG: hypothetical protein WC655_23405 [Candidatus Hydrogenedentales bacterium]|jgi:threonine/homoserine/homoserine lactone efflux protein
MNTEPSSQFFGVLAVAVMIWFCGWCVVQLLKSVRERLAREQACQTSIRRAIERTEGVMRTRPLNGSVFQPRNTRATRN